MTMDASQLAAMHWSICYVDDGEGYIGESKGWLERVTLNRNVGQFEKEVPQAITAAKKCSTHGNSETEKKLRE